MPQNELSEATVETRVPAGKVKSLKLSGIHNCCQPCNQAIKGRFKPSKA